MRESTDEYAPVAGSDPIKLFFIFTVHFGLRWLQADISTAFLHAKDSTTRHYRLPAGHPQHCDKQLIWAGNARYMVCTKPSACGTIASTPSLEVSIFKLWRRMHAFTGIATCLTRFLFYMSTIWCWHLKTIPSLQPLSSS